MFLLLFLGLGLFFVSLCLGLGSRVLGFGVWGLGSRVLGFGVLEFGV